MSIHECAYCGRLADCTEDHIPPRGIYNVPPPAAPPWVWACDRCHGATESLDDEYFRDTVVKHHLVSDLPKAQHAINKMFRGLAHPQKAGYAQASYAALRDVEIRTRAGLIIGRAPAYTVDSPRIERACARYVRGLHVFTLRARPPVASRLTVLFNFDIVREHMDQVLEVFGAGRENHVQEGVFWYAWAQPSDRPDASAWLLMFYDVLPVLGFVRPEPDGVAA